MPAKTSALSGSFLTIDQDALSRLKVAASLPLPVAAKVLLASPDTSPQEIASVLMLERETSKGFWRIALGALVFAHHQKASLPAAPEAVEKEFGELLDSATKNVPELLEKKEFLKHCALVMGRVEAQIEEQVAGAGEAEEPSKRSENSLPRRIYQTGMLPSIRYVSNGCAYACMNYSLADDSNNTLLDDEFGVEDMLFLAESAVSSSKSALISALQVVKEGQLVRHNDDQTLRARKTAIEEDLNELLELLLSLKEAPEAGP